mgnify:CR=1 FL=1
MKVRVDGSEVRELSHDLGEVPDRVIPEVKKSVSRGALNIKNDMARDARSDGSYRHFHRSISYDLVRDGLAAEIGPDKNRVQGPLGNILYFGTSKNAPVLNLGGPLYREAPRFEAALRRIAGDVL